MVIHSCLQGAEVGRLRRRHARQQDSRITSRDAAAARVCRARRRSSFGPLTDSGQTAAEAADWLGAAAPSSPPSEREVMLMAALDACVSQGCLTAYTASPASRRNPRARDRSLLHFDPHELDAALVRVLDEAVRDDVTSASRRAPHRGTPAERRQRRRPHDRSIRRATHRESLVVERSLSNFKRHGLRHTVPRGSQARPCRYTYFSRSCATDRSRRRGSTSTRTPDTCSTPQAKQTPSSPSARRLRMRGLVPQSPREMGHD
jgi:hypothetical protein